MNVIALGFFDGLHLGHGALLRMARRRADELGGRACILSFDVHPDTLVFGVDVPLINTIADRKRIAVERFGMDSFILHPFDRATMQMPWQDFVKKVLIGQYQAAHVVCGHDFCFGYRGEGTAKRLQELCRELGIGCDVVEKVMLYGKIVSSTDIRQLLQRGEVERANLLLGHRHCLTGTVVGGRHLGRTIGIPTANLVIPEKVIVPKFGVYATVIALDGEKKIAVTNVGTRPTVGGNHVTVESWILDFDGDLYGREICVEFCAYLREEQKFPSLSALQEEIKRNAEQARELLRDRP